MDRGEAFRNLILMAAVDGRLAESELRLLAHRAAEWGVTDDEFESALEEARSGRASLALPRGDKEARALAQDLLRMMAADGKMLAEERALFAVASAVMGIPDDEMNRLIDRTLAEDSGECTDA